MEALAFGPFAILMVLFTPWLVIVAIKAVRQARSPGVRRLDTLTQEAHALGATGESPVSEGKSLTLRRSGRTFHVGASDYGKHGPAYVWLGTHLEPSPVSGAAYRSRGAASYLERLPHAVLRHESDWDRTSKRLGLNVELDSGDTPFDSTLYVEHEGDDASVKTVLGLPDFRQAAIEIVDPTTSVVLNGEGYGIAIRWNAWGPPVDLAKAMDRLLALAAAMPPVKSIEVIGPRSQARTVLTLLAVIFGVIISLAVAAAASSKIQPVESSFLHVALGASLAMLLLSVTIAWARARGRPSGLRRFSLTSLVLFLVVPALTSTAIAIANAAGIDASRTVQTSVVKKSYSRSKNSTTYYIHAAPWDEMSAPVKIRVTKSAYDGFEANDRVAIVLGQGRLGWSWVREVR